MSNRPSRIAAGSSKKYEDYDFDDSRERKLAELEDSGSDFEEELKKMQESKSNVVVKKVIKPTKNAPKKPKVEKAKKVKTPKVKKVKKSQATILITINFGNAQIASTRMKMIKHPVPSVKLPNPARLQSLPQKLLLWLLQPLLPQASLPPHF